MIPILLMALLSLNLATAQNAASQTARGFVCDSKTVGGDTSTLKVDADSGDVSISYGTDWLPLYTTGIYCGLKMKAVNCEAAINHNLDNSTKAYDKMTAKYARKISGLDIADAGGYLEINIAGDGNGYFLCGRFAKNDLLLSNCQSTF